VRLTPCQFSMTQWSDGSISVSLRLWDELISE
jgi:hypothetical protein